MRTINECYKEIKSLDSASCIAKGYLYSLAKENKVNNFRSGTRYYIDLDDLFLFFNLDSKQESNEKSIQSA